MSPNRLQWSRFSIFSGKGEHTSSAASIILTVRERRQFRIANQPKIAFPTARRAARHISNTRVSNLNADRFVRVCCSTLSNTVPLSLPPFNPASAESVVCRESDGWCDIARGSSEVTEIVVQIFASGVRKIAERGARFLQTFGETELQATSNRTGQRARSTNYGESGTGRRLDRSKVQRNQRKKGTDKVENSL